MTTELKEQIYQSVTKLLQKTSQNKLAIQAGVSAGNISNIVNHKWDVMSDNIWQRIAANLSIKLEGWNVAVTNTLKATVELLQVAQRRGQSIGIIGDAGVGKSQAYEYYNSRHENVVYVKCAFYYTQRTFMEKFLIALGVEPAGLRLHEMVETAIRKIRSMKKPLVIIDEADKLKDTPFMLFIDFYNNLDGYCGFIISGAPFLKKDIEAKVRKNKRGYREIYSRLGRKFINALKAQYPDVEAVCLANGVSDPTDIENIYLESEGDLRRVKRAIEKRQELQLA